MQKETMARVVGAFLGAVVIASGILAFTPNVGAAQDQGAPPMGRMGGRGFGGRGGPGGPMGPMGMMPGIDPRDLTDAQREQVKAIRERHAADLKPVVDRVAAARKALADAVFNGTGDVRGLAIEVGAAEGELAFQNANIETEILALLTPEQKQKIQDRQKQMAARRTEMEQRRQSRGAGSGNTK
jgi:periplasmic protein CpxP/Spy